MVLVGQVLGDVAAGLDLRDADRAYLVERLEEGHDLGLVPSFDDRNQMMLVGDDTFRELRYVVSGRTLWLHGGRGIGSTLGEQLRTMSDEELARELDAYRQGVDDGQKMGDHPVGLGA